MFCPNCGTQLPDNATFCSSCGAKIGAPAEPASAPAAAPVAAAPALPPILKDLIDNIKSFFFAKNPIGSLVAAAKKNELSGGILVLAFLFIHALACMVNFNQTVSHFVGSALKATGVSYGSSAVKSQVMDFVPSGAFFGFSLLGVFAMIAVFIVLLFVLANYGLKKPLSLAAAVNIIAYGTLPILIMDLANMLLGLIWYVLPPVVFLISALISLYIVYAAFSELCGLERTKLWPFAIVSVAFIVILLLFSYITVNGTISALGGKISDLTGKSYDTIMDILEDLF